MQSILDASIVVISSAIKNNVELNAAYVKRIPVIRRADMLAELMIQKVYCYRRNTW